MPTSVAQDKGLPKTTPPFQPGISLYHRSGDKPLDPTTLLQRHESTPPHKESRRAAHRDVVLRLQCFQNTGNTMRFCMRRRWRLRVNTRIILENYLKPSKHMPHLHLLQRIPDHAKGYQYLDQNRVFASFPAQVWSENTVKCSAFDNCSITNHIPTNGRTQNKWA